MIQVCDSLFPTGAFTLSNGLETMVLEEKIHDEASLQEYVTDFIRLLPYGNTGIMMLSCRNHDDPDFLMRLDSYVTAFRSPREVREGSQKLCRRFIKLFMKIKELPGFRWYQEKIEEGSCMGEYAIAIGIYAAEMGISMYDAASVYTYNQINAVVTNAVKLVPLSQISGQRILFNALPEIPACVEKASQLTIDNLGVSGPGIDISAMNHEKLYSRMYMS